MLRPENVTALRKRPFLGWSHGGVRCSCRIDPGGGMTTRTRRIGVLMGGAAVLSFAGYAIGSQSGDGVALSKSRSGTAGVSGQPVAYGFGGRGDGLEALADKLGVKAADLKKALDDIRKTQ